MDLYIYRCVRYRFFTLGFVMFYELSLRFTGFLTSLVLTLAAYFLILHPEFFHSDIKSIVIIIFTLALLQALVQLIFFINIWKEEEKTLWNFGVFLSTVSIIFIIIFFSIWIINHLNYNMQ